MNIINKRIEEIIPYENNPRKNKDAVIYVSNSIKEFGFNIDFSTDSLFKENERHRTNDTYNLDIIPEDYIDILKQYDCIFSPDFSLYMDMPMAMKIFTEKLKNAKI